MPSYCATPRKPLIAGLILSALLSSAVFPAIASNYEYRHPLTGLVQQAGGGGSQQGVGNLQFEVGYLLEGPWAFGQVNPGASSEWREVRLRNVGAGAVSIGAEGLVVPAPYVIQSDSCAGVELAPQAMCSAQVAFRPTQGGEFAGEFYAVNVDLAVGSGPRVLLSGTSPGAGVSFLDEAGLPLSGWEWVTRQSDAPAPSKTVTLRSSGTMPLVLGATPAVVADGVGVVGIATWGNCRNVTLAVGESCSLSVGVGVKISGSMSPMPARTYTTGLLVSSASLASSQMSPLFYGEITPRAMLRLGGISSSSPLRGGDDMCHLQYQGTHGGVRSDYFCGEGYSYSTYSNTSGCTACYKYLEP